MCVEKVGQTAPAGAAAGGGVLLERFLEKAGSGGDLAAACQEAFCRESEMQLKAGKAGVKIACRQWAEARQRRFEALQRYLQASHKKSFFGKLGKIFGGVFTALSIGAALVLGPTATPVLVLSLLSAGSVGGCSVVASYYNLNMARAQAQQRRQESLAQRTLSQRQEFEQYLEKAVQFEADMIRHVRRVCELENSARLG